MANKSAKDIQMLILKSLYNRAYTILMSAMNSQFRFETIIQSCLYYSDIVCISYIYIYESAFQFVWQIEFPIFVNSRHKIAFESDKNNPKSPRLYENQLYDFKAIFLHSTCVNKLKCRALL